VSGYRDQTDEVLARLRRIEGQVRGLQRMVSEDAYCIDVLTQVAAATRALQAVSVSLLSGHLHHCVTEAVAAADGSATAKVDEAVGAVQRLLRS
jgi:DNA-binding FrmR family transcriptional regulator